MKVWFWSHFSSVFLWESSIALPLTWEFSGDATSCCHLHHHKKFHRGKHCIPTNEREVWQHWSTMVVWKRPIGVQIMLKFSTDTSSCCHLHHHNYQSYRVKTSPQLTNVWCNHNGPLWLYKSNKIESKLPGSAQVMQFLAVTCTTLITKALR